MPTPDLSVVIVSYNTRDLLRQCLDSLFEAERIVALEVVVVDNCSADGSRAMLADYPRPITVIANESNVGFAMANNQGLAIASAPVVLLLNSDAFITGPVLVGPLEVLRTRPDVGVVGVRLDNPDGTVQARYGAFPSLWDDIRASTGLDQVTLSRPRRSICSGPVDWVQGACMFVRVTALEQVGGLDTRYHMYSEEVDWCRRFWADGWRVWYLGSVGVVHLGGASSSGHDLTRRIALYQSRLGLRRRMGGPFSSFCLWLVMLAGLTVRILGRSAAQLAVGRRFGRQSPRGDWQLARAVLRMDPLARWAAT